MFLNRHRDWKQIQKYDAMENLKQKLESLEIFQESVIETPPVLKERKAYWTDRIFYASLPNCKIQQEATQEIFLKNRFFISRFFTFFFFSNTNLKKYFFFSIQAII